MSTSNTSAADPALSLQLPSQLISGHGRKSEQKSRLRKGGSEKGLLVILLNQ